MARFIILMLTAITVAVVCLVAGLRLSTAARELGPASDSLNPVERVLLLSYLAARSAELAAPAGSDATPVAFTVEPGETAREIAQRLAAQGLVGDAQLLNYYLRYRGLDNAVEAGDFVLQPTMTTVEIAAALARAGARQATVRIVEGWRLEQIADALSANPDLNISRAEFLELVGPGGRRNGYSFTGDLPQDASLEGFLFPDTYRFRTGAGADVVLDKILANLDARLPNTYRADVAKRGLNLYQAITIASLIEREAVVADERPMIASVILNRLAIGQRLEIDATVQYALGAPGNWWPSVGGLDFRRLASPYNTYYIGGLPIGPIANPGLDSILAVASPADTDFLYYRALCDGSGRHAFARTYEEHLGNACR